MIVPCLGEGQGRGKKSVARERPKLPNSSLDESRQNVLRARRLRRESSISEQLVWEALRGGRTGFRFRRQHPVGKYILDFYCPEAMLCVEADGPHHIERQVQDAERDEFLLSIGVLTLRFFATDLFSETRTEADAWIRQITSVCEERTGRKHWEPRS